MFDDAVGVDPLAREAALVDRIAELERGKSANAAEQAELTMELDTARRAREAAAGVAANRRGKGLASEIALARLDSPNRGGRLLNFARILVSDMPHTLAALAAGVLTEARAMLIVRESADLSAQDRGVLDAELCADQRALEGKGDGRITTDAKEISYRLNPQGAVDAAVRAEWERTVTIRPAPNAMSYVTAVLPMTQGAAVHAALAQQADTAFDGRTRGQVLADTLVERVTGRPAHVPVPIAVNLVMTDETLLGAGSTPARMPGRGPIPAAIARRLVAAAVFEPDSRSTLRRLYRHPKSGALVAMESRARLFPKRLATFIDLRDDRCRTPYCDAPIRHHDHATDHARGGPTNAVNGLGECAACNYAKQAPGWQVTTSQDDAGAHTAHFSTPTGAIHHSHAPPLPGRPPPPPAAIDRGWPRHAA